MIEILTVIAIFGGIALLIAGIVKVSNKAISNEIDARQANVDAKEAQKDADAMAGEPPVGFGLLAKLRKHAKRK